MMTRSLLLTALLAAGSAAAFDEMSASADGRGSVAVANARSAVVRAEVSLTIDGDFVISLSGEDSFRFRGDWRQINNRRVELTITEAEGEAVSGSGVITLQRDRFQRIQITAGSANALRADFVATGDYTDFTRTSGSAPANDEEVRAPVIGGRTPIRGKTPTAPAAPEAHEPPVVTVKGEGKFARSGLQTRDVGGMEIFLYDAGRLHLKIFAKGYETVLQGSWREVPAARARAARRYEVSITNSSEGRMTGRGYVTVDARSRPQQVTLNGRSLAEDWTYSLQFNVR